MLPSSSHRRTDHPQQLDLPGETAQVLHEYEDVTLEFHVALEHRGPDAVVHGPWHPGTEVAPRFVSRVLTEAMTDLGVRRLVVTSVYPIVADKHRLPIALLRLLFADAYADVSTMEQIVSACDLDWTIVRLNRLTDRPARGGVRVSGGLFDKPSAMSRSDVATALLDVVDDDTTVKAAINTAGLDSGR